jgi:predicted porin
MKHRKTQLAAAVSAALLVGGTAVQAQAPAAPPAALTVQLYGQVSRALMFADDGFQSKWFHVDGQPSSTRFGIQGTSQIAPGLRAGARIETEMKSNPSDVVSFQPHATTTTTTGVAGPSAGAVAVPAASTLGTTTPSDAPLFAERWLDAFFEGAWGRINLGQGSGAADDASTIDLSGTGMANGTCVCDWGGGIFWRTAAGGILGQTATAVGTRVIDTHNNNDFESRYDRVMYTTPVFGGFRAQAGTGQKSDAGEVNEASVWYSGKILGELQAALGWSEEKTGTATTPHNETVGGSISWLSTFGLNVTFAMTQAEISTAGRDKQKFWWTKVGYKFGAHAIAVDYNQTEDMAANGDEGKTYGIGYVWNPIRWAEIYVGYRIYQLDRPATAIEDIKIGQIGTRLRF